MALEDVVQGVQVNVKTDGVDDAKSKIGELDKAIGSLAKTAESAAGGGPGGGAAGVGGLNKAFGDLNTVAAQAFSTIVKSAAGGDLTGLATLMGGPVAGSFVETGKAIASFIQTQDDAILKNAAMAREFGTTPVAMQGIKEGFEGAGVSATGFERLVNRMSRQVQNDYAEMTRNIRTDSDTQEGAVLRLQAAQEKLAISKGADPASFQYQDKIRQQKFDQIAVDQAEEAVRQQALKSIPHVTELLKQSAESGRQNADLTEVSTKTLRESIENMARLGEGPASPVDVLKKEAELIKSGAIDIDTAIKLLKDQGGMSRAAGLGGMDAVHEAEYFKKYGASGIEAAQAGKSVVARAGLGQTAEDTKKATETISEWSRLTGLINAAMQKIAAYGSGEGSTLNYVIKGGENVIKGISLWYDFQNRLKAAIDAGAPTADSRTGWGGIEDAWTRMKAAFTAPKPEEKIDPKTGQPIGTHTEPWRENVGSGPALLIHVPEGWTGHAPVTKATEESIGSGPGKMIHIPEHYNEPGWKEGQPITRPYDPNDPRYQHMSVTDEANAPWRSLRGPAAPAAPPAEPGGLIDWFKSLYRAPSEGASAVAQIPGRGPATAAPTPPAITVNPASPAITVNVTAPVTVSVGTGGAATATPGTGTASVAAGQADGGLISIPGFADGGMIQSFADGGMSQGIPNAWPQDISSNPMSTQAILKKLYDASPHSMEEARDMARGFVQGHLTGAAMEKTGVNALEAVGIYGAKRAVGMSVGVLSNPFNTGLLDSTEVGAADRSAGAASEEARARSMGAHNLKELSERESMWGGGIPGFAMGSIRGPGTGTSDSILARVSNGEFVMKDAAVRTYGEGFMHAINNMQIPPPKYAYGGMVPASTVSHFSEGGAMERPGSILNLHVGGEVFKGLKAPAAVADQLRRFALDQQTTQTGRKPTWAGA